MKRRDHPAGNIQGLERWLTDWAAEQSMTPGRLRRRVGMIAIAAMIDDLNKPEPRFIFKGGAAFEFRFGDKARTSSDIDAIFRGNLDDAIVLLKEAIETGWSGFSGRLVDDGPFEVPGVPIPPLKATVKLTYKGKAFISVPIEVASPEGRSLDHIDVVEINPLHELGLEGPSTVPVLAPPYQIAQKLHACTTVATDGRLNDRVHDLADLIMLDELTEFSLAETHAACIEVFSLRNMHAWPPALTVWPHWPAIWAEIVRVDSFPVSDVRDAASKVESRITRILAARGADG
jgi:Nucleotidyl transferase AbiEii toxin, Type IV TA system